MIQIYNAGMDMIAQTVENRTTGYTYNADYPNCNTQVAEAIWKSYINKYKDTYGYPAGFYWWNSGVPTKSSTAHPYLADIG